MPRPKRSERHWLKERNGVWQICWYNEETKRTDSFGLRTRDHDEALDKYQAWRTQPQALRVTKGRDACPTVTEALDDYYNEHCLTNAVDHVRQENAIRHLKAHFGDVLLSSIDIPACRAYTAVRARGAIGGKAKKQGVRRAGTPSTVRRELNVLRAAANHALKWKRITQAEFPTFELPVETAINQEEGFLSKSDIAVLIFHAEGDLRDFILLAYYWGARRASVETLEARQVSLQLKRVNLMKPGARITKKRKPAVPVFPEIKRVLERRMAAGGFLFGPTVDFYKPFRALCERLGMAHSNPHVLRHSRATHMLMDGENPYKVARLLGDTLKTIERVYGGHSIDFLMEDAA